MKIWLVILTALLLLRVPLKDWQSYPEPRKKETADALAKWYSTRHPHCTKIAINWKLSREYISFYGECLEPPSTDI